ncbi:MAG: DUF4012 domain-containing protein [Patescibacteria group bacterium]|nr:DUF4012 domain-containing protein [Patescibacteria group bacterium]
MSELKNPFQSTWKDAFIKALPQKDHIMWSTIIVAALIIIFYGYQAIDAYRNARQISKLVQPLQESLVNRDWDQSKEILNSVNTNIKELESTINRLYPITLIPGISGEVKASRSLLAAAKVSIASGALVIDWAKTIPILSETEFGAFDELTVQDKSTLLASLADSSELWERVNNQTILSLSFLKDAQAQTKILIINSQVNNLTSKLYQAQSLFSQIQPWIAVAPQVLGHPREKTYLLLLQNNTELRPTGGFIGTYGVLKVRNGEISSFITDNVYNLDEPAKAFNTKVPPLPLQKYIKQSQWFFRDVNWDPDFPTTAQNAIQFYKDERGPVRNFDGVIAFTPELIEDLLQVVGPVYVDEKEFTADNLIDTLAYHVELGFKEEGVNIYNRKQIIDDVAQQLKEKLFSLSLDQMRDFAPLVFDALSERQIMFYFSDEKVGDIVAGFKWDGRILGAKGDYLHIVDANLGSLKSDPAINRSISYSIEAVGEESESLEDIQLQATASITYEHTADFDWKTTRYRTYTRIYVPQGSIFVSAEGNEEELAITDEHNKTVFGTFISIEPLDTETLSFTYILPQELTQQILEEGYRLYIQKQAGTRAHDLVIDIELPFKIDSIIPSDIFDKKGGNQITGTWDLGEDREVLIQSK